MSIGLATRGYICTPNAGGARTILVHEQEVLLSNDAITIELASTPLEIIVDVDLLVVDVNTNEIIIDVDPDSFVTEFC